MQHSAQGPCCCTASYPGLSPFFKSPGKALFPPRTPSASVVTSSTREDFVDFSHLVGLELQEGSDGSLALHKASSLGSRWNASAVSGHFLTGACVGPRGICFRPSKIAGSGGYVIGLASAKGDRSRDLEEDQGLASVGLGVHVVGKSSTTANLDVRERGNLVGTFGTFTTSDRLELVVNDDSKVEFRVNGQVRHTSERCPEMPLHVKVCACSTGSVVREVRWVGPGLLQSAKRHLQRQEEQRQQVQGIEQQLQQLVKLCRAQSEQHQRVVREQDREQSKMDKMAWVLEQRLSEVSDHFAARGAEHQNFAAAVEAQLGETVSDRQSCGQRLNVIGEKLTDLQEQQCSGEARIKEEGEDWELNTGQGWQSMERELGALQSRLAEEATRYLRESLQQPKQPQQLSRSFTGPCCAKQSESEDEPASAHSFAERLESLVSDHDVLLEQREAAVLEDAAGSADAELAEKCRQRLKGAEAELGQLHCSLANEHLAEIEKRLRQQQRGLLAELTDGRTELATPSSSCSSSSGSNLCAVAEKQRRPTAPQVPVPPLVGLAKGPAAVPTPPLALPAGKVPANAAAQLGERLARLAALEERMKAARAKAGGAA